jgi:hypothetical protein
VTCSSSDVRDGEHLILVIDTTAGTREICLLVVIEFHSCLPCVCGFIGDGTTADHEVLYLIIDVVEVFLGSHI